MVKAFVEGETYRNIKLDKDMMVYGIGYEDDTEVVLAIGWVDRESEEMISVGEISVKKSDFSQWEIVTL